jgi:hypothetical protein
MLSTSECVELLTYLDTVIDSSQFCPLFCQIVFSGKKYRVGLKGSWQKARVGLGTHFKMISIDL